MPDGQLSSFVYVTVEKATVYRAVMRAFMEARGRFAIHLRPGEVRDELERLRRQGAEELGEALHVEAVLSQLVAWGNLEQQRDTADVATVEDFYRPRFLYQLTPAGEAAERAVALFEGELLQEGELQVSALDDLQALLGELLDLATQDPLDVAKVRLTLGSLVGRFEDLTQRAQAFLRSLQRSIDLFTLGVEQFLVYKESLIGYLERFVRELVVAGSAIATRLLELEEVGVEPVLRAAAERDLVDALEPTDDDRLRALEAWTGAWTGFRSWFLAAGAGQVSQAELLRARARSAITALLTAVTGINDRRTNRSDRVSDLKTLARWFAEAESDGDAHRLWRAAFGLAPARHLQVNGETLDERAERPVSARTSWLTAPPIRIAPRLRATGSTRRRGRPKALVDRTAEKAELARQSAREAEELEAARQGLATGRRVRLSELSELDRGAFRLFLDLLGQALTQKLDPNEAVCVSSTDGSLELVLEPTDDERIATITTRDGELTGRDHWVTIRDVLREGEGEGEDPAELAASEPELAEVSS